MKKIHIYIIIVISVILIYEFLHGLYRQYQRNYIYKIAKNVSNELKKPLVVIGDPYNGVGSNIYNLFMDGYECGDETIDITGAPLCENGKKIDLLSYLKLQPSNSKILFISCVLEYVDDLDEIIEELYRVSYNNNIFIVTVNEYSLFAYIYRQQDHYSKNIIYGPPKYDKIYYKKI